MRLFLGKALSLSALLAVIMTAYLLWARPHQLRLGATDEEVSRHMPGDELHGRPTFLATRAITIEGTPEQIWPWLIQMGYNRAGFYGYDILENLGSKHGLRSADHILPEFQRFEVGDEVPISAVARMVFYAIDPNRYIIWSGQEQDFPGGFTWALYPIDESHTRLVSRIGWSHHWSQLSLLGLDLFTEFTDHIAVRKILQGVKGRVEDHIEPAAVQDLEFGLYVLVLLIFAFSLLLLVLRQPSWNMWLSTLFAGAVWLLTWYASVPTWVGAVLGCMVVYAMVQALRKGVRDA